MRTITLSIEGAGDETCGTCPLRVLHLDSTLSTATHSCCALWHSRIPLDAGRRWPECLSAEGRTESGPRVTLTPLGECR